MTTVSKRRTLEQFLKLPEKKPALELEEGRVIQKAAEGIPQRSTGGAGQLFDGFAEPRRLARALSELRTTYDERSYVPDVAVYTWERISVDERGWVANDFWDPLTSRWSSAPS